MIYLEVNLGDFVMKNLKDALTEIKLILDHLKIIYSVENNIIEFSIPLSNLGTNILCKFVYDNGIITFCTKHSAEYDANFDELRSLLVILEERYTLGIKLNEQSHRIESRHSFNYLTCQDSKSKLQAYITAYSYVYNWYEASLLGVLKNVLSVQEAAKPIDLDRTQKVRHALTGIL